MNSTAGVSVHKLGFSYQSQRALEDVEFEVAQGEVFGVLGPNGGGKTTLFRILATLLSGYQGEVRILGHDLRHEKQSVRSEIGVVFQSPSVDPKLSVAENLRLHGSLYGRSGSELNLAVDDALARLGLSERKNAWVETLSGGLKRRVELAKCLLSRPRILILDEPSTGLDPGARLGLWDHLRTIREAEGVTVLVTTHLMAEAERCDRLIILDHGRIVSAGSPAELRSRIGGDVVTVRSSNPEELAPRIEGEVGQTPVNIDGTLRLERSDGPMLVKQLIETFPEEIEEISLAKPTLEDVFIHETGRRFWNAP